jgi:hypothetical protein
MSDAATFNWSLTEFFHHLVDNGWSEQQALPKVWHAIADGDVQYQVFEQRGDELVANQPIGRTDYWMADVRLRMERGEVLALPAGVPGWEPRGLVWRVPEGAARAAARKSNTQEAAIPESLPPKQRLILRLTIEVFGPSWAEYPFKTRCKRVDNKFAEKGLRSPAMRTYKLAYKAAANWVGLK